MGTVAAPSLFPPYRTVGQATIAAEVVPVALPQLGDEVGAVEVEVLDAAGEVAEHLDALLDVRDAA